MNKFICLITIFVLANQAITKSSSTSSNSNSNASEEQEKCQKAAKEFFKKAYDSKDFNERKGLINDLSNVCKDLSKKENGAEMVEQAIKSEAVGQKQECSQKVNRLVKKLNGGEDKELTQEKELHLVDKIMTFCFAETKGNGNSSSSSNSNVSNSSSNSSLSQDEKMELFEKVKEAEAAEEYEKNNGETSSDSDSGNSDSEQSQNSGSSETQEEEKEEDKAFIQGAVNDQGSDHTSGSGDKPVIDQNEAEDKQESSEEHKIEEKEEKAVEGSANGSTTQSQTPHAEKTRRLLLAH